MTDHVTTGTVGPWTATANHRRAALIGAAGSLLAVVLHRPDVLVLTAPFVLVTTWAMLARPSTGVAIRSGVTTATVHEGESTTWVLEADLPPGADAIVTALGAASFVAATPALGLAATGVESTVTAPDPGAGDGSRRVRTGVTVRPTRWGVRPIGAPTVAALSVWGGYRVDPTGLPVPRLTALPGSVPFTANAPMPHPRGLVGPGRSSRSGSGSEFHSLREFQPGDRLRRVHWPVSLRTGRLHVSSTYADEDSHVVLVVDAYSDVGPREGVDGRPTSLDLTVRAAAAIAEHHLGAGDRVSLRIVGVAARTLLPPRSGRSHLRRVLHALARVEPATEERPNAQAAVTGIRADDLVLVLSPLLDPAIVDLVARLGARGVSTIVIDTMPDHLWGDAADRYTALAWRVRRLGRSVDVAALESAGIAVVPWRGPASLDDVLRDISRRARAPRVGHR